MLARFFHKSEPIGFVSLILLLFIYTLIEFFNSLNFTISLSSMLVLLGSFIFFSVIVFFSDFIIRKNELTPANYYAVFILVLLFGLFPTVIHLSSISFSHFFVLLAVRRIYSIRTKKMLLLKLFDSGLYIGVAFLLYPISAIYLLLIYISYFIYIRVINKDLLIPILGFITPIFLAFTYYFIFDKIGEFKNITEINLGYDVAKFADQSLYIPLVGLLFIIVLALYKNIANRHSLDNEGKNSISLVVNHLVITVILFSFDNLKLEENIQFIFLPVAVLVGNLILLTKKGWLKEMLLYTILLLTFFVPFILS